MKLVVKKHVSQGKYQAAGFSIGLLIAVYGIYVFIKRNFLTYMFLYMGRNFNDRFRMAEIDAYMLEKRLFL